MVLLIQIQTLKKAHPNKQIQNVTLCTTITDNLDYSITDLHVVAEDEGYHIVLSVPSTPDMLQKLCEDSLNCINGYSEEHNVSITKINPIITIKHQCCFWLDDRWYSVFYRYIPYCKRCYCF